MSEEEAKEYVDIIVEKLCEWGVIPEQSFGHMTENQRQELAEMLSVKSRE